MKFKPFKKYRDSEVIWLGRIPFNWKAKRLKFVTKKIIDGTHFTPDYQDEGVPFLRVTDITSPPPVDFSSVKRISHEEHLELNLRCNPERGDLLLSKNGTIGVPYIVDWEEPFSLFVSLCLLKLKPDIHVDFLKYIFLSKEIAEQINAGGKKNTIVNLHLDKIKEFFLALPPIGEQRAISAFLDRETVRIDDLIQKKENFVKLLDEKRLSLITKAVSRGLNPKAKLQATKVDWAPQMPSHWHLKKLKYVVSKVGSGVTPSGGATTYLDEGIPFLRSQNIYSDRLELSDLAFISEEVHHSMANSKAYPGDVLLNITGASLGRCFYLDNNIREANVNQHVCIIRPVRKKLITKYLHYLLISDIGQNQIWVEQTGSGREGLNFQSIKAFIFPTPPVTEQQQISEYLDSEVIKINSLKVKTIEAISTLQEYRTALISAAVTGKINVSNYEGNN